MLEQFAVYIKDRSMLNLLGVPRAKLAFMSGYVAAGLLTITVSVAEVYNCDADKKRGKACYRKAQEP